MDRLEIGQAYLIEYEDASYSYANELPHDARPKTVLVVGRLRRHTDSFLDVAMTWLDGTDIYQDGCIIPKRAVLHVNTLTYL